MIPFLVQQQMQKQVMGELSSLIMHTGRKIPIIGYGTYQLKGDECRAGTRCALDNGYVHIDTASIYKNEGEIREVLSKMKFPRENLFITSKISPSQQGYENAKSACNQIIKSLNCEYLDLLLIHWPGVSKVETSSPMNAQLRLQTWKALTELQGQGKVRDIGVSNFLKHHLEHLIKHTDQKPAVNQFEIHPLLWEKQTIEFCRQNGIIIEAYSPLARNHDKLFHSKTMQQIADKHKKSIAQVSLRWCIQHGFVVLPKSKNPARIKENIEIFDFTLTEAEMHQIQQLNGKSVRTCWNPHSITH